jgi:hypothetical protein
MWGNLHTDQGGSHGEKSKGARALLLRQLTSSHRAEGEG